VPVAAFETARALLGAAARREPKCEIVYLERTGCALFAVYALLGSYGSELVTRLFMLPEVSRIIRIVGGYAGVGSD